MSLEKNQDSNNGNINDNDYDNDEKLLNKKTKRDSEGKDICLMEYGENGKKEIGRTKVDSCQKLSSYLSSLKNPYTFRNGQFLDLSNKEGQTVFYYDEGLNTIYQREEAKGELIYEYTLLFQEYLDNPEKPKINYPINIERLTVGPKFFFNLTGKNYPKFYGMINRNQLGLNIFFELDEFQIFHLFTRKGCGTSLYFMKQMHRHTEYYIYFDIRKLKLIMEMSNNSLKLKDMKKFILYSLFHIHGYYISINFGLKRIEKYFYYLWNIIYDDIINCNNNKFIITLLNAYISMINKYILHFLNIEKEQEYQTIVIILDHYQYDFDLELVNDIVKNNPKIRFIIKYQLNNTKAIETFFKFIEKDNFKISIYEPCKGIEVSNEKKKIIIGYYYEMINLNEKIFDDKDLRTLTLYKEELIEYFGLNNQLYFFKFLEYMGKQTQDKKDKKNITIFNKFIQITSNEIERNISLFYNNDLSEEIHFISKYYNEFLLEEKPHNDKKLIDFIKKNIPLDYFIILYSPSSKDIINIIPASNLIKKIISKKSKYFGSIIYQSKHYDTLNKSEQGNILQRSVEEKLQIEPNILFNYLEKTFIFKLEYIIPSATFSQNKRKDPVEIFYKETVEAKRINKKSDKLNDKNITSYMSKEEIRDMENLKKEAFSKEKKGLYKNIILIQNDSRAKNYDLGIIRFIGKNHYVLFLIRITVSRENIKFGGVNCRLEKDICYITSKINNFFPNYKSDGVHLIYVLDKIDENIIPELNIINNNISNEIIIKDDKHKNFKMKEIIFPKIDKANIDEKKTKRYRSLKNLNKKGIHSNIDYKYNLPSQLNSQVHLLFFSRKFLNFFNEEGKMVKELIYENGNLIFNVSEVKHYFPNVYLQKMYDNIIRSFNIKIGKIYYSEYDYDDVTGNYLIFTKIEINLFTVIINIKGKIIHFLKIKDNIISEIKNNNNNNGKEKISYFFEIINPEEVNVIQLFEDIIIED